jgi:sulfur carrier protein
MVLYDINQTLKGECFMKIVVAGEKKEVAEGLTVAALIEQENVETPQYVTVSVNEEFIDSDKFDSYALKDGDEIEFLYFMGGGAL